MCNEDRGFKEDRPQGIEPVDIIASGYEWICPICGKINREIEYTEIVTCDRDKCRVSFKTNDPEHAMG